jgi:hypothetical protein
MKALALPAADPLSTAILDRLVANLAPAKRRELQRRLQAEKTSLP